MRAGCSTAHCIAAALLGAAAAMADTTPANPTLTRYVGAHASQGSRLWAQYGDRPLVIGVANGVITTVEPMTPGVSLASTPESPIEWVDGLVVLPGLIDAHTHHATEPDLLGARAELAREIHGGVTTVRDMAGDVRLLGELQREGLAGEIPAPDLRYSALVAGADFFTDPRTHAATVGLVPGQVAWMRAVTVSSDGPTLIREAQATGAAGLKIYANLSGDTVRGLIAAAHEAHFPVWTHLAVYPATPTDSIGATSVSHVCMLARAMLEPNKRRYGHADEPDYTNVDVNDPTIEAYGRALAAAGTVLDATVTVYPISLPEGRHGCTRALAGRLTRRLIDLGVSVAAGTDHDAPVGRPEPALYDELDALVESVGLSPAKALLAATEGSAAALGAQESLGKIAPGYTADFLFLREDPATDLHHLTSLVQVIHRGLPLGSRPADQTPLSRPSP
jgi:imidazolonepropionase-like amidohydrolase